MMVLWMTVPTEMACKEARTKGGRGRQWLEVARSACGIRSSGSIQKQSGARRESMKNGSKLLASLLSRRVESE
jgi:hypothetical protein